jgi:hypothetical protein
VLAQYFLELLVSAANRVEAAKYFKLAADQG